MKRRLLPGLALPLALLATACPSGYEMKLVPGAGHVNAKAVITDLADEAREKCKAGLEPYVHCETEPLLCRTDPSTREVVSDATCEGTKTLLTFVHTSDAQLKEDQVGLDGPLSVGVYDRINGASQRNRDLERYDFSVLLANVLGINSLAAAGGTRAPGAYGACAKPLAPSFVLHTGDAVDAGMFSELFEFLTVMRQLDVPFFNAVGNHDTLFFGTFPKGVMRGVDVTLPFVPLGDLDRFLRAHDADATFDDPSIPYAAMTDHSGTLRDHPGLPEPGTPPAPFFGSKYSGFDLICPTPPPETDREKAERKLRDGRMASPSFPVSGSRLCSDAHGYYGQDFLLPDENGRHRKVRLLVLNTAELGPATLVEALEQRSRGSMREEQYLWLASELAGHRERDTLFLVAGHHTLGSFYGAEDGRLRNMLLAEPRVAAYLSGHTHVDALRKFERPNGIPLWEDTAGSTLVYPQLAHLVDLLERPNGELYLRVRTFRQRVSDVFCSSDCNLKYLAARARVGAYDDIHDGDHRLESVAKVAGNGMFRVSGFDGVEKGNGSAK
ncbi:MAG TPA: metallophosphoesterase family protein [Polyangiaceae bacterium]|nr:metallophosphoesterase family protein [Polyangiaceae bacterium]